MRKVIVGIVAVAIWGAAIGYYLQKRAEDRQKEQAREQRRAEMNKPPPPPPPPVFGPGRGEFETYFKEKHPLSNKPELLRRLALREGPAPATLPGQSAPPGFVQPSAGDYDVTKETFRIFVPEKYDATQPHGIIYYLGYKDTLWMPAEWKPQLERSHLIFISPRNSQEPDWQKAAIALDAVHNLKKQYTIDDRRIYLFAYPDRPGIIGEQMSFGLPDVFSGFVNIERLDHFRPVRIPIVNRVYSPNLPVPPAPLAALSRTRPHVFVMSDVSTQSPGLPDKRETFKNALEQEGFQHLLFVNISDREDLHYPAFKGPWLEQTLKFLDASATEAAPTTNPVQ